MKKILYLIIILLSASCTSNSGQNDQEQSPDSYTYTAFTNITIIDGKGNPPISDMVVVLKDSLIYDIAKMDNYEFPKQTKVIDSKGKYMIPGLIDMHAHVTVLPMNSNKRLSDTIDKEASLASLKTLLAYGITTIRNPAAPTKDGLELKGLVEGNDSIISPDIFTSGSALNRTKAFFGPFVATTTEEDVRNEVKAQINSGVDFIKVYSSLKPNLIKAAIDEAHKSNIKVIGHLQNTSWTEAANLGIDFISHAAPWNTIYIPKDKRDAKEKFRPMVQRLYWLENVNYNSDVFIELFKSLKENKVSIDPTLIAFHTKFWGDDSMYINSPNLHLAHPTILNVWNTATFTDSWLEEDFERAKLQWDKLLLLTKLLYDNGILITCGSDFPNPWVLPGISLHQEMKLLNDAQIPNLDVIKIATYNGAKALGIENKKGSIEKGKVADLIILNKNPLEKIQNTLSIDLILKSGKSFTQKNLLHK